MCASGKATQHTIRRCTIRKIIKTEFLSPRVFIDFSYWASRRLGKFNLKNPPDGGFFDLQNLGNFITIIIGKDNPWKILIFMMNI
jgi:hypothetical protein